MRDTMFLEKITDTDRRPFSNASTPTYAQSVRSHNRPLSTLLLRPPADVRMRTRQVSATMAVDILSRKIARLCALFSFFVDKWPCTIRFPQRKLGACPLRSLFPHRLGRNKLCLRSRAFPFRFSVCFEAFHGQHPPPRHGAPVNVCTRLLPPQTCN